MASALETRDHFKDVSTDAVHRSHALTQYQSRPNRLPSLDNVSSLTFGSAFGVGKSMWNDTSSIWRSTNKFTDGAADEGTPLDSMPMMHTVVPNQDTETQTHGETPTPIPSKIGSKSLLSSSESDVPPSRKNVPWATSVHTTSFVSRSQNQPISPLRQRHDNPLTISHRTSQNGALATSTSTPTHGDFQSFPAVSAQKTNGSRHYVDMNTLAEYLPTCDGTQSVSTPNANLGAFRMNGTSNLIPTSRVFQESPDGLRNSLYQQHALGLNDALNETFNNGSFQASRKGHEFEQFSPGYKARAYGPGSNGHFETGNPAAQLPNDSQARQSEFRPSYQRHVIALTATRAHDITDGRGNAPASARSDSFQNYGHQPFPSCTRNGSFGDLNNASPTASEYKRSFYSPYYSNSGTPPTGPESMRTASNSGISSCASHGYGQSFDRGYKDAGPFRDYHSLQPNPLQGNYGYPPQHELSGYPGAMRMNPLANPYTVPGYLSMSGVPSAARLQSRESEHPQVVRSSLLEDFRMNNKNNKRYELRDIYNHVVEFSGDQHGSRFIQQKLETANSDEKDQIFTEIQPNLLQLMTDVFGNYVIQKLFEHGNQSQKKMLANQMKGHVLSLSTQMYGCRVVQKALEHVLTDQQASIVKELESHVLKCVKDQNGNHVIQKAIERVPAEHIHFIISAFTDQVQRLATHPYGCRVIQRMLEHCQEPARKSILQELHSCVPRLITDQFGNYVIQHVIENGEAEDKHRIVVIVLAQLLVYSKHKFASNVVEKSIEFAQEDQRSEILRRLTGQDEHGESPVLGLMRDQYGNYVIRKLNASVVPYPC
jgi:mRNA-binding protein PUF3